MITFPNAKINIGLNVLNRRPDGFHNIETILVPIRLCDFLEIIEYDGNTRGRCEFNVTGIRVGGNLDENLCVKAYHLLHKLQKLPSVKIHLHKNIPIGAGMGGGSTDGAFTLKILNSLFSLGISAADLQSYCKELGSDCSFFIKNEISFAVERGDVMHPISLDINDCHVVIINPYIHVNTASMYDSLTPNEGAKGQLKKAVTGPLGNWKDTIVNEFELPVFAQHPELESIKTRLYAMGAVYTSMTGSGSTIYGIFSDLPNVGRAFPGCFVWQDKFKL